MPFCFTSFCLYWYQTLCLEESRSDKWGERSRYLTCCLTIFPNRTVLCGFTMWISAGQPMWTTGDIFSGVYKDPASAIMVTPGKWKEVISQHCGDCLSGKTRFNPHNFLHQNHSFKLETTAVVSVYAAPTQPLIWFLLRCCFIGSLIWSASRLIFFHDSPHYSPLASFREPQPGFQTTIESQGSERCWESSELFNSLKQNQEIFEENL